MKGYFADYEWMGRYDVLVYPRLNRLMGGRRGPWKITLT
jgi:hypothetical protein